jgi:hypothetical protein
LKSPPIKIGYGLSFARFTFIDYQGKTYTNIAQTKITSGNKEKRDKREKQAMATNQPPSWH